LIIPYNRVLALVKNNVDRFDTIGILNHPVRITGPNQPKKDTALTRAANYKHKKPAMSILLTAGV
jgi:hypothetical protein